MEFTDIKNQLFEKYKIFPENIKIKGELACDEDKIYLINLLLYGYELAEKNSLKGSLTTSSYASCVVLSDKSVHFGINFNATRNEISSICAERLAILEAYRNKVEEYKEGEAFNPEIEYVLMSSYKEKGRCYEDKITPCADCLSWFNTGIFLTSNTKICALKKAQNGEIFLDVQNLKDFLPQRNTVHMTVSSDNMKVFRTEGAQSSDITDEKIKELYKKVKNIYETNTFSQTSGQNIAAGIISNGEIFTGKKIDYSKRWFTEPLEMASYKAIEKFGTNTKIDAICYVGDEYTITEAGKKAKDGLISIKTLGRIATKFADGKTLVITGSNRGIEARTIEDYMPNKHKFIQTYEIN